MTAVEEAAFQAGAHAVSVRVPANPDFLQVLRAVARGAAARVGASIDDVADIRLAVNEVAAMLLSDCPEASTIWMQIVGLEGSDRNSVEILVGVEIDRVLDWAGPAFRTSLGWKVISALADVTEPIARPSGPTIRLVRTLGRPT